MPCSRLPARASAPPERPARQCPPGAAGARGDDQALPPERAQASPDPTFRHPATPRSRSKPPAGASQYPQAPFTGGTRLGTRTRAAAPLAATTAAPTIMHARQHAHVPANPTTVASTAPAHVYVDEDPARKRTPASAPRAFFAFDLIYLDEDPARQATAFCRLSVPRFSGRGFLVAPAPQASSYPYFKHAPVALGSARPPCV